MMAPRSRNTPPVRSATGVDAKTGVLPAAYVFHLTDPSKFSRYRCQQVEDGLQFPPLSSGSHSDCVPLCYPRYSHLHALRKLPTGRLTIKVWIGTATVYVSACPKSAPQTKCTNSSSKAWRRRYDCVYKGLMLSADTIHRRILHPFTLTCPIC